MTMAISCTTRSADVRELWLRQITRSGRSECVRGALGAKLPNAAPPLTLSRFWFYTTPLVDLWPWGVNLALTLSDLGSVCVEEVTFT